VLERRKSHKQTDSETSFTADRVVQLYHLPHACTISDIRHLFNSLGIVILIITRSTQRAQTSAERQHNRIAEWFLQCKLFMQLSPLGTFFSIIQWIWISDFGLLDLDGDPNRHQNLSPWSLGHALPLQEIPSKSVPTFSVIKQTDKQTDKQTEVKT